MVGLIGGLMVATAGYLAVRPKHELPPPVEQPSVTVRPVDAARPQEPSWPIQPGSRDEQVRRFSEGVYREFGANKFWIRERPSSPFIMAGELNDWVTLTLMFDEFEKALDSLLVSLRAEFGDPIGDFNEILPVVIFTSRATFDEYLRKGNNPPLPPEVPGVYEYSKRRVVFLHGRSGYPIEVILHEAVHQVVHYHIRHQAEHDRHQTWWFQEGMATYFEQFKRGPTGNVVVDPALTSPRLPALREMAQRGELPELQRLMGLDIEDIWTHWNRPGGSPDAQERKMRFTQLCYGHVWVLVHYLRHGAGGKYRKLFDEYFKRELRGEGGMDAFIRLLSDRFGMELQELEHEIAAYIAALGN
jgi:hypothetical protein